jgi:ribosomal-protein-alanine N-acetyltransferase
VRGAVRFAFSDLGLHRVEAACLPGNEPSRRLLERVGFRCEGEARAYLRINGNWADHLLYAMISTDRLLGPAETGGAR